MRIRRQRLCSILGSAMAVAAVVGLEGCSVSPSAAPAASSGMAFGGHIFGGSQPVSNASIQLYTPGTNGYGSASTPLLNQPVTTDANGFFSITGDYSCPSATSPVYLVATGGNPGLAPGTNNSAIALMGLLGQCGTLTPTSFHQPRRTQYGCGRVGACSLYGGLCAHRDESWECARIC